MKKLTILIGVLFSFSCAKKNELPLKNEISGRWDMVSYSAFMPSVPLLNKGDIIWTFDTRNNVLVIENKVESQYPYITPSGTYSVTTTTTPNTVTFLSRQYEYSHTNGALVLKDHPEVDGPTITFNRN